MPGYKKAILILQGKNGDMEKNIEYGKLNKKIVFTENDHRHAQLIVKLKHDSIRQSEFFRSMITGYLKINQSKRELNLKSCEIRGNKYCQIAAYQMTKLATFSI